MSYKINQVLRTRVPLQDKRGTAVPPTARVVVTSVSKTDGAVRAKVADYTLPNLLGVRLVAKEGAFSRTKRGRPKNVVLPQA